MILLRRHFKFYGYLLMSIAFLIFIALLVMSIRNRATSSDKIILFYIFVSAYCLFIIYVFFKIISAVRRVAVNDDGILFGKKEWKWSEIKEIRFSEIGFLLGQNENQTVIVGKNSKRRVIYNSYYSNFSAFSSYILAKRDQWQHIEIFPKEAASTTNYLVNKKYKAYNIFSVYNLVLLLSVLVFVVPMLSSKTIVWYWGTIILIACFMIWFAFVLYMANYIEIDNDKIHVRKLFFPSFKRSYQLSNIDHVVFHQNGSSAARVMVIDKKFVAKNYFVSNIKRSVLKDLKNDLERMGITVTYKL